MDHDELLTVEEAAEELEVSTRTLASWRNSGTHELPYLKIGRDVRYRQSDIDAFLDGLEEEDDEDAEDDDET